MTGTSTTSRLRRRAGGLLGAVLLVGLVVPVLPAAAAGDSSATIRPEIAGNTAVRAGQWLRVSGTAPDGPVTSAQLVAVQRDGGEVRQGYGPTTLERPSTAEQYLRSDAGVISGRLALNCVFDEPDKACPVPHGDVVQVRLELVAGGVPLVTGALRVDYTRPFITGYRVVSPGVVEARFNEPVRGDDNPLDWRVDDPASVVVGVRPGSGDCGYLPPSDGRSERSGCTRLLDVVPPLSEDSAPLVTYQPPLIRPLYVDDAGNAVSRDSSSTANTSRALDAVRPAVPGVDQVEGTAPSGPVAGRNEAPVLRVSNLTAGHQVRVERLPADGSTPVRGAEVEATGSTAELIAPLLPTDGSYVLRVVARDPAGNESTESTKTPPRADGRPNPVTYVLDRVSPEISTAVVEDAKLRVRFTEAVSGPDSSSDWQVRDAAGAERRVDGVEGDGKSRLLTVRDGAPPGGQLDYAPPSGRYADAAGNTLKPISGVDIGGLPLPVVTLPAGPLVTRETSVRVTGTARPGSTVNVFRSDAPDVVLDSAPVAPDGTWSVTAPLQSDTDNELRVQAVEQGEPASPLAVVPTVTQDGQQPGLSLSRPAGQEVLTSGSRSTVHWSTADANPGTVQVEISTDGVSWQSLGAVSASRSGTQELAYTVPAVDVAEARVRVTSVDQAGNSASRTSLPFRIDGVTPRFSAITTDARSGSPRRVTVRFTEPVSGPVGDWRIGGQPAVLRSADGASSPPLSVSGARVLVFETSSTFGPDSRPEVTYSPAPGGELRDSSTPGHPVAVGDRAVVALDGIRPPVPSITSVAGDSPSDGRVTDTDLAPEVQVSGLLPDNDVWVERVPAAGAPERGPVVTSTGGTATLRAPSLPGPGEHVLRVVAQDRSENLSTDTSKNPGGSDGAPNPVTYVLQGVVQDVTEPVVRVLRPTGGQVLAGGSPSTVRYSTSDDNPGQLRVEITTDGASFSPLGTVERPANGEGELDVTVPDVDTDAAQVRITAVDQAGNRAQALSPAFTIDALHPTFVALTTTPRMVRLTFSEPVSGRVSPLTDFRVDGQPATVTSIDGSPSTTAAGARTLELTVPAGVGEDARPSVTYAPSPLGQLVDRVGQAVEQRVVTAVDGIRPAVPTVTAVDGRAPRDGRVLGGNVVPQVSVANLVAGQFVRVERVPVDGPPVAGQEVQTQDGTALVPGPRLPRDGDHVLRVVVRDATGNTSTDTAKSPGRGDGGPSTVTYVLDTQLPAVLFAVADGDDITVRFSEALFPAGGNPADWRVTRADGSPVPRGDGSVTVVAVRGTGDTRVLQATGVQPGSLLVYSPAGERYTDANSNPLPDTTTPLLALEPPVVTTPARALLVTSETTPVAGTSQPGSTVSLLRRGRDGGPSGAPLATARTGEDGRWSLTAPLDVDRANDFLVQARRTDGRDTIAVPVPTITQDGAAPVLSVDGLPGDQQRLAPGSARTLAWSVCDANLGATPIALEFSADDGATWSRLGPERLASPNDCTASTSRRVTLPGTGETTAARLRVSAVDLAGRTTRILSPRFVLAGETQVRDVRGYACPPDRVRPAGFTDTSTSTFRFEIDCLAAYDFTKGVTADRYEPLGTVTRAQMAMFVARVASYAGVPLDSSDAGFNDIATRSQETRDAVNALANLGVVEGVGGGRYAPAAPVSRGQMASFLARVQQRVGSPFGASRNAFRDDDRTTHEANIDLIAGAGIVQGTAPGTYQPLAPITRQQMAGFLVRYVDGQIEAGEMRSAY